MPAALIVANTPNQQASFRVYRFQLYSGAITWPAFN
jgi:hypothetical protein